MWIETQKGRCSGTARPWHLGVKHGTSRVPPPMALSIPSPWLWTGDTESPRVTAKPGYCHSLPMGARGAVIFLQGCLSPDQTLWKNETFLDKMQFLSCEGPAVPPKPGAVSAHVHLHSAADTTEVAQTSTDFVIATNCCTVVIRHVLPFPQTC